MNTNITQPANATPGGGGRGIGTPITAATGSSGSTANATTGGGGGGLSTPVCEWRFVSVGVITIGSNGAAGNATPITTGAGGTGSEETT